MATPQEQPLQDRLQTIDVLASPLERRAQPWLEMWGWSCEWFESHSTHWPQNMSSRYWQEMPDFLLLRILNVLQHKYKIIISTINNIWEAHKRKTKITLHVFTSFSTRSFPVYEENIHRELNKNLVKKLNSL